MTHRLALSVALRSDSAYTILDSYPEIEGSTFTVGGCRVLAEALMKVLPEPTMYALLASERLGPQHYVVQSGGLYHDADGASSEASLLKRWSEQEHLSRPFLEPATKDLIDQSPDIPNPSGAAEELAAFLGPRLQGRRGASAARVKWGL